MENRINYLTNELIDKLVSESEVPANSLSIKIPFSYALELVKINWSDILFSIENGYFDNDSAIEYAAILLGNDETDGKILDLACLNPSEITREELLQNFVVELANRIPEKSIEETKDKIMYVLLNLLFDKRRNFEDPLKAVEIVYDDFNFPKSIENFVRYMLIEDDLDSIATKEKIYNNWSEYLYNQKSRFGA